MSSNSTPAATEILARAVNGDANAVAALTPLVYNELQRLAHYFLRSDQHITLQTTAVVHEAFLRLVGQKEQPDWSSRAHFMAVAAKAMRSVLLDHARARSAQKRGGGAARVVFDEALRALDERGFDYLELEEALNELARHDERKARLVELKFFAGQTTEDAARFLEISVPTAEREWRFARAWLTSRLAGSERSAS
ncbi:MAG: ECF-type sigma factor [Phycisphaerae bacterium]